MARARIRYRCSACNAEQAQWSGQCAACSAWNTLQEAGGGNERGSRSARDGYAGATPAVRRLADVGTLAHARTPTGIGELDRVLGGGLVGGSVVLLGGEPGAGKSTLLLQVCAALAATLPVLYVTGEESLEQVALRARRLDVGAESLLLAAETRTEALIELITTQKPALVVVDSIQVMGVEHSDSAPGSLVQVRESAALLTRTAKQTGTVIILVGHVTKEGGIAGPKVLEHMIDTFLMLDGSSDQRFRTLRSHKNRFGAVNELGVFAMTERGMREVTNPSAIFLARTDQVAPGSAVTVIWEGSRPLLLEIQALVDPASGGNGRRIAVGIDAQRLSLQLAVLHRHGGLAVSDHDVYANVVGGIRVSETASDLALQLAVASSFRDSALPRDLIVFGEVGLAGEVRPVPNGQERLREAAKHGFRHAIVPAGNHPKKGIIGVHVKGVNSLAEALEAAFT